MFRSLLVASLTALCLWGQGAPPSTPEEIAVVREINKIRRFPREYAKYLRALGADFEGKRWKPLDHETIQTEEGRAAVLEAAAFLETVPPVMELITYCEALHLSARDHVLDRGPQGLFGHEGSDGSKPAQRMSKYGEWDIYAGEVINYGNETPRMTVIQLVIDDGVRNRGHRHLLFDSRFRMAGASIGYHKEFGTMVVVDLAGSFTPRER